MIIYDLNIKDDWLKAVEMAASLGWFHATRNHPRVTAQVLMMHLRVKAHLTNVLAGHSQELRKVYGASYWAAQMAVKADKSEVGE